MRKALVTLAVGKVPEARWSHPLFRAYAQKHGFDFIVLDQWKIRRWWPLNRRKRSHFEKFQMHGLLETYDRIVYLDGDILISPDCPDLTILVPVDHLGVVADERGPDSWRRRKELADAQAKLGEVSRGEELYFNCGMLVLSACHRPLLNPENRWPAVRWPEQTGINFYARKYDVPVMYLGETYNYMPVVGAEWQEQARRLSARLVHYAGLQDRPRMGEDAPAFFRAWGLEGA